MEEMDKLTRDILRWQNDGTGFQSVLRQISELVISRPRKAYGWSEDECCEFYCFFYRRMIKLAGNFRYKGISFKALLYYSMDWQMKTFHRKYRTGERREYCLKYDSILSAEDVCDSSADNCLTVPEHVRKSLKVDSSGRITDRGLRKRVIMLLLKNSPYINDAYVDAAVRLTACDRKWLDGVLLELRDRTERKLRRYNNFASASNRAYSEICALHRDFSDCRTAAEKELLLSRLLLLKQRLKRACINKSNVKLMPTNTEISEVMMLPKGSIDSGLFYLKRCLQDIHGSEKTPD